MNKAVPTLSVIASEIPHPFKSSPVSWRSPAGTIADRETETTMAMPNIKTIVPSERKKTQIFKTISD
jgi:hypothetical protein